MPKQCGTLKLKGTEFKDMLKKQMDNRTRIEKCEKDLVTEKSMLTLRKTV